MGTWSFSYDAVDRLVTAHNTAASSLTNNYTGLYGCWSYDSYGNRLSESMSTTACTGSPGKASWATYNTASNRMLTSSYATSGVTLDASGDMADDGRNSYWYDAEGRVCAVHSSVTGTNVQYVYGPSGERIAQGTPSSLPSGAAALCSAPTASGSAFSNVSVTKRYLVDLGGAQVTELNGSGTWQHSNVFSGGRLTVSYDSKGIHYDLADPLGTKRVQANAQGQVDENCFSLPFGNDVNNPLTATCSAPANSLATNSDATEHHFTQKERDAESGNDYMFARYYSSALGRFLSPDWSVKVMPVPYAKLNDPQTLNLYAYVGNNPVVHVDLDGHCMGWCDLHGNQAYDPNNHPYQYQSDAEKDQKKQQAQQNLDPTADAAKGGAQRTGAVTSTNVGGVWVNAYGGTADQRTAELAAFTDDVTKTDRGKAMLSALQSRKSGLFGLWGAPKPFDLIQVASGGSYSYVGAQAIMLDYHDVGAGYTSASGGGTYSLRRIFAHELGHAAMGNLDNGPGRMNNVNWNENPVMRQLGDFNDRTTY